jgi:hypothetical protein
MAMLAWVIMGLAIWHFTIFLPDRFWAGSSARSSLHWSARSYAASLSAGSRSPARATPTSSKRSRRSPGTLIGIAIAWFEGVRRGNAALEL